jgi:hypothetical protein
MAETMFTRQKLCDVFRCASLRMCLALSTAGALAAFSGGCGGDRGPQRVVVSGVVTYNGKPIPDGAIVFAPDATSNTPTSGTTIVNGKYKVDIHGGVPVGQHKIQIEAYRNDKSVCSRFPDVGARIQYLPKKYNVKTELEIAIQPSSQNITKDFDLID